MELIINDSISSDSAMRDFRPYSSDVVLLCMAIDHPNSLNKIRNFWKAKISDVRLIILVGTKADLRVSDSSNDFITHNQGEDVAREIGAKAYIECSAMNRLGCETVFEIAAMESLKLKPILRNCSLL